MIDWIYQPEAWVALLTLTALEIVLGIDNIIFLSILVGRLPVAQQPMARSLGLLLAMGTRILLLLSLAWLTRLTAPWFEIWQYTFSGRDCVLILGGLFLLAKSTQEIHHSIEEPYAHEQPANMTGGKAQFGWILVQIAILDIVFSLDSVITAVGMAQQVSVMVLAIMTSVLIMLFAVKPIGAFIEKHPTLKILALSFLMIVGLALISDGFKFHIPRGYIYFSMAFSVCVEMLNIRMRAAMVKNDG